MGLHLRYPGVEPHSSHDCRPHPGGSRSTACCAFLLSLIATLHSFDAVWADDLPADVAIAAEARTQSPLADPVVTADAEVFGRRVNAWTDGGAQFLLLDGDVKVTIGSYAFDAERASLRIDTERTRGRRIRHISLYLHNATSPGGRGAISAAAPRLFVTVSTTGEFKVSSDAWSDDSAANDPLVVEGEARLNRYLQSLSGSTTTLPDDAGKRLSIEPGAARPLPVRPPAADLPAPTEGAAAVVDPESRIMPAEGILAFNADKFVFEKGETESTVSLIGQVRLMQIDANGQVTMTLRAENAVLFMELTDMAGLAGNKAQSGNVKAIYLESNVIVTDGEYTLRAPRVFYDLRRNKALVLEAVLFAWDHRRQIPLYVRAERLRQESRKTFTGSKAQFTTSEFGHPHVAIAADRVTFQQKEQPGGETANLYTATHSTIRVRDVPVFYWPVLAGDAQDTPLRTISATYSSTNGPEIRTTWDLFSILGRESPPGVRLDGELDYIGEHGPAIGAELTYDRPDMFGRIHGYLLPLDSGDDELGAGRIIDHDNDIRGIFHGVHRHYLPEDWELTLELSLISDETFLEEFFYDDANQGRPHETSLYLKRQREDTQFSLLLSYDLNQFTPQLITLQNPGYIVEKLPEIGWHQVGTPFWENRLTYFGDSSLAYMRIGAGKDSPSERGFTESQSQALFGFSTFTPFDAGARAAGIPTDFVLRFDSRHELQAPMKLSIFNVTPFVSARFTGYDTSFENFAGENDPYRVFATAGVRLHTQFSRSYDDVDIRLLDVHRLRHIVEPNADITHGYSTSDPRTFPIFDPDVEGLSDGYGFRIGLRNTLQTQRGAEGRWRSVNWVTLDTDLVFRGDNSDADRPLARFFSYRPEYSRGGDHFYSRLLIALTDSLALAGEVTYDLETPELAVWRVGATYAQTRDLSWFVSYTEIDDLPSKLLSWGFNYRLTAKYDVSFAQTMDLVGSQSRTVGVMLTRKLPRWRLIVRISHDEIQNEQQFAIILIPDGIRAGSGFFSGL